MKDLSQIRKEIDSIDDELSALYAKRMELVKEVAESKAQTKKATSDPERETQYYIDLHLKLTTI